MLANVGPFLRVHLRVGVWRAEVEAAGDRQVLHAHLEHGGIDEPGPAEHDHGTADGAAQRAERAGLVDAERAKFLDVVRLAHQADAAPEADDVLFRLAQ